MARNGIRTRLVQIGNSRGVRIPKALIQQAGLREEVDLHVQNGSVIISSPQDPRAGWAEAFAAMNKRGEDKMLGPEWISNKFDESEWEW